ncbi:MAG: M20/M25/M40 family metallo-hydrolase [Elusimicrobiota bacterium]
MDKHLRAVAAAMLLTAQSAAAQETVWVSLDRADAAAMKTAGILKENPLTTHGMEVLYEVSARRLPVLSDFMHETFKRCAGFFAYRTRAEAEADLVAKAVTAAGPYTVDSQSVVSPLSALVQEGSIRATIEELSAFHTRYHSSDTGLDAARWLEGRWKFLSRNRPGASVRLFAHDGWKQPSVVLTIPGSRKPDEIVVLGGHLDSIVRGGPPERSPGADDNASGIAVLTEAVRVLGESDVRFERTVQFIGYSAEEVGLRGSQDVAAQAAREGKKIIGVIQFDMTNYRGSGERIFLLTDFVDRDLTAFLGRLIDAYAGVPWSTAACGYACSDHAAWTRKGFPAAAAFESSINEMNPALHTARDTLATTGGTAEHSVPFAKLAIAFAVEAAKTSSLSR